MSGGSARVRIGIADRRRRIVTRIGALLLAPALLAAAPAYLATRPLSRMDLPWWRQRFEAKAAQLREGHVALIWYGDSITADWERDGPEAWDDFAPIWRRFYGDRNAVNLGFKGDTTANLLWRVENGEASGVSPRVAIVLIGANNFGRVHWGAAPTLAGIAAVIEALRQRLPHTHLILLSVLPSIRSVWVTQNTVAVDRALAERYGGDPAVSYIDVTGLFLRDGRVDPAMFIDPHLTPPDPPLHPTAQAQQRIAEVIEPVVARWMGDRNKLAETTARAAPPTP